MRSWGLMPSTPLSPTADGILMRGRGLAAMRAQLIWDEAITNGLTNTLP